MSAARVATVDLTEFLLARIAEDEAPARSATLGPWVAKPAYSEGSEHAYEVESENLEAAYPRSVVSHQHYEGGGSNHVDAAHIARHDPARVLAECEAKRELVALYAAHSHEANADHHWTGFPGGYATATDHMMHALLLPYANHPDFREEWVE